MYKKIVAIMILALSLQAGGLWDMVKNSGLTTIHTKPYQIEVQGVNIRAYVFQIKELPLVRCISFWGEGAASHQVQCIKYSQKEWNKLVK